MARRTAFCSKQSPTFYKITFVWGIFTSWIRCWTTEVPRNKHLLFVISAPAIFQQLMEQVLPKLPKVVCYMDDILITATMEEGHLHNLKLCLKASSNMSNIPSANFFKNLSNIWATSSAKEASLPFHRKFLPLSMYILPQMFQSYVCF